jgi:hypothetical protein
MSERPPGQGPPDLGVLKSHALGDGPGGELLRPHFGGHSDDRGHNVFAPRRERCATVLAGWHSIAAT